MGRILGAALLPQIEQSALYDAIQWGQGSPTGTDQASLALQNLAQAQIAFFRCPSESGSLTSAGEGGSGGTISGRYCTNYLACSGGNAFTNDISTATGVIDMTESNGVFRISTCGGPTRSWKTTRVRDITDGTSNTFLLGEAMFVMCTNGAVSGGDRYALFHPKFYSIQCGDGYDFSQTLGSCFCVPNTPLTTTMSIKGLNFTPFMFSFSSYHSGGVQMAMCDGSAFLLGYDRLGDLACLGSMAGGEVIDQKKY